MKTTRINVVCLLLLALSHISSGQGKVSVEINGQSFVPQNIKAGIEKVMDKYFFAVVLTTENQSLSLTISYDRIKGKTSAIIDEVPSANYDRFDVIWNPNKKTSDSWIIKKGTLNITGFDETSKKVTASFEGTLMHFMNEKGSMVAGKDPQILNFKGELKEVPFIKVN